MTLRVLVTGGMGFIGRHVTSALLQHGHSVRILDNFNEQVHGTDPGAKALAEAEVVRGDIRDLDTVSKCVKGMDAVIHLAAEVGVGQSMYEITRYVGVNELGTGVMMQALVEHPVKRIVTASSMSVYGEGLYRDADGNLLETVRRKPGGGKDGGAWDPADANGRLLEPVATPEWKRPNLSSIYALNKYAQEQMTLIAPPAYGIEAVALRLFNVYGPGQALSNPYTGVLAIFASRILNGRAPMIFEDGQQRRDFVHVDDIARAFLLALEHPNAPGEVFNIASGQEVTILELTARLLRTMGRDDLVPEVTGQERIGDIRHCFADIGKARDLLGFVPQRRMDEGFRELADWVSTQTAADHVARMRQELESRGLVV